MSRAFIKAASASSTIRSSLVAIFEYLSTTEPTEPPQRPPTSYLTFDNQNFTPSTQRLSSSSPASLPTVDAMALAFSSPTPIDISTVDVSWDSNVLFASYPTITSLDVSAWDSDTIFTDYPASPSPNSSSWDFDAAITSHLTSVSSHQSPNTTAIFLKFPPNSRSWQKAAAQEERITKTYLRFASHGPGLDSPETRLQFWHQRRRKLGKNQRADFKMSTRDAVRTGSLLRFEVLAEGAAEMEAQEEEAGGEEGKMRGEGGKTAEKRGEEESEWSDGDFERILLCNW